MIALYVLLILMIVGAVIAIEVKDLLSSVVAVGAVGLGLSLTCLVLKAPDVAITQLVVEIIAVIILIKATLSMKVPRITPDSKLITAFIAGLFILVSLVVAGQCFGDLPTFGLPTMRVAQHYLDQGVRETGAVNFVASILLDYRAYDTLGEATVLFTAVIGVLAVVRRIGRKEGADLTETSHD